MTLARVYRPVCGCTTAARLYESDGAGKETRVLDADGKLIDSALSHEMPRGTRACCVIETPCAAHVGDAGQVVQAQKISFKCGCVTEELLRCDMSKGMPEQTMQVYSRQVDTKAYGAWPAGYLGRKCKKHENVSDVDLYQTCLDDPINQGPAD